jgi:hypothetical protein
LLTFHPVPCVCTGQIAAIQDQAAQRAEAWGGVERALSSRCREAEAKAHGADTRERQAQGLLIEANSKVSSLEAKLQQEKNAREVKQLYFLETVVHQLTRVV